MVDIIPARFERRNISTSEISFSEISTEKLRKAVAFDESEKVYSLNFKDFLYDELVRNLLENDLVSTLLDRTFSTVFNGFTTQMKSPLRFFIVNFEAIFIPGAFDIYVFSEDGNAMLYFEHEEILSIFYRL